MKLSSKVIARDTCAPHALSSRCEPTISRATAEYLIRSSIRCSPRFDGPHTHTHRCGRCRSLGRHSRALVLLEICLSTMLSLDSRRRVISREPRLGRPGASQTPTTLIEMDKELEARVTRWRAFQMNEYEVIRDGLDYKLDEDKRGCYDEAVRCCCFTPSVSRFSSQPAGTRGWLARSTRFPLASLPSPETRKLSVRSALAPTSAIKRRVCSFLC